MVKTTKSDLPRFAIFSIIVYKQNANDLTLKVLKISGVQYANEDI